MAGPKNCNGDARAPGGGSRLVRRAERPCRADAPRRGAPLLQVAAANRIGAACYRRRVVRVWVLGLAVVVAAPEAHARRAKTNQVTPGKRAKYKPDADLSRGGERKGGIEIALGSITAVLAATLVGRGIWELVKADRIAKACADGTTADPTCSLDNPPGRGGKVAGGLSLAFSVPVAVASGFLFRYGLRIRRDHEKFHRENEATASFSPWVGRSGGGASIRVRF